MTERTDIQENKRHGDSPGLPNGLHPFRKRDAEDVHRVAEGAGNDRDQAEALVADCGVFLAEDLRVVVVLVEFLGQVVSKVSHQCRGVGGTCFADLVRVAAENLDDPVFPRARKLKQNRNAEDLSEYAAHSETLLNDLGIPNKTEKRILSKISNLSIEQAAHLAVVGIPFYSKKAGDGTVTIFFEKDKLDSIKTALKQLQEKNQKNKLNKPKR